MEDLTPKHLEQQRNLEQLATTQTVHAFVMGRCGSEPDVVFSHAGGVGPIPGTSPRKEAFRTLAFGADALSEHGQVTGGRTRVIATKAMADTFPDMDIVTNSYNRLDPTWPTFAAVIRGELEQRGVDPARIFEETRSFSTLTQLIEMVNYTVEHNENLEEGQRPYENVAVMTNEYHMPRVRAMFDRLGTIDNTDFQTNLQKFDAMGVNIAYVPAEPVMRAVHPLFGYYLDAVAKTPQFQYTQSKEAQGLADLEAGTYKLVLQAENPRA